MKALVLTVISIGVIPQLSYSLPAKKVPVSAGFWYSDASVDSSSCKANPKYKYVNLASSPNGVASFLQAQLTPQKGCTWQPGTLQLVTAQPWLVPPGFPGNSDDVNKLHAKIYQWTAYCDDNTHTPITSTLSYIWPGYLCPNGTIDYSPQNGTEGCYPSYAQACNADVTARDNDIPFVHKLGHAGIISNEQCSSDRTDCTSTTLDSSPLTSAVYEVQPTTSGAKSSIGVRPPLFPMRIAKDSLTSFISDNKNFYGVRYGLPNQKITPLEITYIIEKAKIMQETQSQYPVLYSIFPFINTFDGSWDPKGYLDGGVYNVNVYTPALGYFKVGQVAGVYVFRCDTFVIFCYNEGGGIDLGTDSEPGNIINPKKLFYKFTTERDLSPTSIVSSFLSDSRLTPTTQPSLEQQITAEFASSDFDINQASSLFYQYIEVDNTESRIDKINFLWGLAQKYEDDDGRFYFLTNALEAFKPVELADDMISIFKSTKDKVIKQGLLMLMSSCTYYPADSAPNLSTAQINDLVKIINFLKTTSLSEKDTDLAKSSMIFTMMTMPDNLAMQFYNKHENRITQVLGASLAQKEWLTLFFSINKNNPTKVMKTLKSKQNDLSFTRNAIWVLNHYPMQDLSFSLREDLAQYFKQIGAQASDSSPTPTYWASLVLKLQNFTGKEKSELLQKWLKDENISTQLDMLAQMKIQDLKLLNKDQIKKIESSISRLNGGYRNSNLNTRGIKVLNLLVQSN